MTCVCMCAGTGVDLGLSETAAEFVWQDLGPFGWLLCAWGLCTAHTHTHTHTHSRMAVSWSGCEIYDPVMPLGCVCLRMQYMLSPGCECTHFCGCVWTCVGVAQFTGGIYSCWGVCACFRPAVPQSVQLWHSGCMFQGQAVTGCACLRLCHGVHDPPPALCACLWWQGGACGLTPSPPGLGGWGRRPGNRRGPLCSCRPDPR